MLRGKSADGYGMGHQTSLSQDDFCASLMATEKLNKLFVIGASQIERERESWDWSVSRKDSGDVISVHTYLKGSSFSLVLRDRTRGNWYKQEDRRFPLSIREHNSIARVTEHWHRQLREGGRYLWRYSEAA